MRKITLIVVHCSANKQGSTLRLSDIDRYHRSFGWNGCGYHYVIPTDGTIEPARPEAQNGAHCKNHKDTRTEAQKRALKELLTTLHNRYPKALIVGHCDLDPKKPHCPGFDVSQEFKDLNPPLAYP